MSCTPSPVDFDHVREPLGLGTGTPRLSWTLPPGSDPQYGYEIEVERENCTERSGFVLSERQVLVAWPSAPLTSRERAKVRVRVWTGPQAGPGGWGEPRTVEAGLLEPEDWKAVPVGPRWPENPDSDRRPGRVRRDFTLTRPVVRARLYISAHGLYEAEINGRRVGHDTLSPGWTVYRERLRYQTYDVTELLTAGANTIGAWLGDGWYRGRIGFDGGYRNLFGSDQSLLAQLEITHDEGPPTLVVTDSSWSAAAGPILFSGLYEGERFDARLHEPTWCTPSGRTQDWSPVAVGHRDPATLIAPTGPPVRCTRSLAPVATTVHDDGRMILDFGQNLVGRLRITVDGPAGTVIRLRHAEVLQDGELATRPLREASACDTLTLSGTPIAWEPRFTLHGFRYAEITGWPGNLDQSEAHTLIRDAVRARVHHTDMRRTGWFECSDPLVNRLHENVLWSMRGNFVDLPTDCPQRDERLGWTGDIQVFAPTAAFLYDCAGMLDSWLSDVAVEQLPDGTVPWYVPVIPGGPQWTPIRPGAAWGDAATLTPWLLYRRYGDLELLARHFPTGRAWVDLMARLAGPGRVWDTGPQLGDWLDPAAPPDDPGAGLTDRYLVATGYFAWSAQHVALAAAELGHPDLAEYYGGLAEEVAQAFRRRYTDGARVAGDSPTAYALALVFGLLEEAQRQPAADRLAELVLGNGARIATGFVGTPLICDALTEHGHVEVAYRLLLQTECPSWLYPVTMGATTIWERWDSLRPDGTLNPGGMTSFNHYALGAVADWLHRVVAGMEETSPGYRTLRFRPRPGGGLTWARARHETPYGTAAIGWELVGSQLVVQVTVPPGCEAVVELPGQEPIPVGAGEHRLETADLHPDAA